MSEEKKPDPETCERCGYERDSFPCRIRKVYLQHGWAKKDH